MKFWKIYFLVATIFLFPSCRYEDYTVKINSDVAKMKFDNTMNSSISVYVEDKRQYHDFIGFKTTESVWDLNPQCKKPDYFSGYRDGYFFKTSKLNSAQDLSKEIQSKFTKALKNKGFSIDTFAINKIRVEITELSFVPTMYRNFVTSKFNVVFFNATQRIEKSYTKEFISYKPMLRATLLGPMDFGSDGDYYDEVINEAIDQNIAQILNDDQIWKLLATNKN